MLLQDEFDCIGGCPMNAFCDYGICRCRTGYDARYVSSVMEYIKKSFQYLIVTVRLSGILKVKQKLGVTFNFNKQDVN